MSVISTYYKLLFV